MFVLTYTSEPLICILCIVALIVAQVFLTKGITDDVQYESRVIVYNNFYGNLLARLFTDENNRLSIIGDMFGMTLTISIATLLMLNKFVHFDMYITLSNLFLLLISLLVFTLIYVLQNTYDKEMQLPALATYFGTSLPFVILFGYLILHLNFWQFMLANFHVQDLIIILFTVVYLAFLIVYLKKLVKAIKLFYTLTKFNAEYQARLNREGYGINVMQEIHDQCVNVQLCSLELSPNLAYLFKILDYNFDLHDMCSDKPDRCDDLVKLFKQTKKDYLNSLDLEIIKPKANSITINNVTYTNPLFGNYMRDSDLIDNSWNQRDLINDIYFVSSKNKEQARRDFASLLEVFLLHASLKYQIKIDVHEVKRVARKIADHLLIVKY